MNIRDTFLRLTSKTYPHGTEEELVRYLPSGIQEDIIGNYFIKIGESDTIFTCHLDTCCSEQKNVKHILGSRFVKTDGSTILGADDKAGMTVLLYMIEKKIPGLYYFFIGEEVGCIGSGNAVKHLTFEGYKKCISFDRRGYRSVITDQFYGNCCSDEFATVLSNELNSKNLGFSFYPDDTGVLTDSASFMEIIPECTNISVGYFDEHRSTERQDLIFLEDLCEACVKIDWENLPIVRDPYRQDTQSLYSDNSTPDDWLYEDDYDDYETSFSSMINVWIDNQKWLARIKNDRLIEERSYIYDWLILQGYYNDIRGIDWDGKSCTIEYENSNEYLGEREDIMYMIGQLEEIPLDDLILIERI